MGAVFALVFFGCLLVLGLLGIAAGAVCLSLISRSRRQGNRVSGLAVFLSWCLLIGGILLALFPLGFFVFIVITDLSV